MTLIVRSIRQRLFLFAALGTLIVILCAGIGLAALFERHVERGIGQELDSYIARIAANLRIGADGKATIVRLPSDPRFERVFSGLYWQVHDETANTFLRSRSLWDAHLVVPEAQADPGATWSGRIEAPNGQTALVHAKTVILTAMGKEHRLRIAVGIDRASITELRTGFARDLVPGLLLLGGLIIGAAWLHVNAGLRPLAAVRGGLSEIQERRAARLSIEVPDEIRPLVDEINSLLSAQELALVRARDHAADLAHGLRTPLTALVSDIDRLRASGQEQIAADIATLAAQMHRTVERELARARLRHRNSSARPVRIAPVIDGIIRTLSRTPQGEALLFDNDLDERTAVALHPDDLTEIFGNLLENSARAARSRVRVTALDNDSFLTVRIDDDGPGADPEEMERLTTRGMRQDETGGAGLGLAIVSDILAGCGGEIGFARSLLGGLSVRVALPRQDFA